MIIVIIISSSKAERAVRQSVGSTLAERVRRVRWTSNITIAILLMLLLLLLLVLVLLLTMASTLAQRVARALPSLPRSRQAAPLNMYV